jgi:hypothetical protein
MVQIIKKRKKKTVKISYSLNKTGSELFRTNIPMKELDIKEDETIQNQKHQVPFRGM